MLKYATPQKPFSSCSHLPAFHGRDAEGHTNQAFAIGAPGDRWKTSFADGSVAVDKDSTEIHYCVTVMTVGTELMDYHPPVAETWDRITQAAVLHQVISKLSGALCF